ncbi:MAG: UTP--glucose-1-phosphate uridylyltransferase [Actinobacteria bacterium]|nr:UTP--glucose-1-phosphate uridylyltransferase [Actinomycetota bacterium]
MADPAPAPRRVRKAVIPAAGLGTRFLPASKAIPKEMLPVVDKPAIQYVVEEAVRAGIEDVLIVTGRSKRALEDHFDRNPELEALLAARGKEAELASVVGVTGLCSIHLIRQHEALGLGHAVALAEHHVGDEPFAVLLADEFWRPDADVLPGMIDAVERTGGSVVAFLEVAMEETRRYGCAAAEAPDPSLGLPANVVRLTGLVEKPLPREAPSNLAIMGRYVLQPEVFEHLHRITPGAGGELQLTDALASLLAVQPMFGWTFTEGRYDTGQLLDYLKVVVDLALARDDVGGPLLDHLREVVGRHTVPPSGAG